MQARAWWGREIRSAMISFAIAATSGCSDGASGQRDGGDDASANETASAPAGLEAGAPTLPADALLDGSTVDSSAELDAPGAMDTPAGFDGTVFRPDLAAGDVPAAAQSGFVAMPSGWFEMGSSPDEDQAQAAEQPRHQVGISHPFLIADHEVTHGEWREVMGDDPSYNKTCGDECPVELITWYSALAFANALSDAAGLPSCYVLQGCQGGTSGSLACTGVDFAGLACPGFRLPTEAEWEYAARAGSSGPTQLIEPITDWWTCRSWNGDTEYSNPLLTFCRYICSDGDGPAPVRSLLPNAWGLYDMAGNVGEWVWDAYGPYAGDTVVDPLGPESGTTRVVRSAYAARYGPDCRNARRDQLEPDWMGNGIGLRLVRSLP